MGDEGFLGTPLREELVEQKMVVLCWDLRLHPFGFRHKKVGFVEGGHKLKFVEVPNSFTRIKTQNKKFEFEFERFEVRVWVKCRCTAN